MSSRAAGAEPTTIGSTALLLAGALARYGCDVDAIFAQAGLDPHPRQPLAVRYPVARMQIVWRLAAEHSGDPCFGLTVAEQIQPQTLHGLGFAWLASDTLLDALQRLVRYQRLLSTVADFRLAETEQEIQFSLNVVQQAPHLHPMTIDAAMAIFLRMCRLALQHDFKPLRVALRREKPACAERFSELFACPVQFAAPLDAFCLDRSLLNRPLPSADPELARANDQVVIDYLKRFDQQTVSMRVRALLIELLPGGQPTQTQVASALNMSVRNLQRRLHDEGCGFKQLLEETRRELAAQYIRQTHRPIGEITYLLGFSEPSNFTRAFRRWTGCSPMEFRQGGPR